LVKSHLAVFACLGALALPASAQNARLPPANQIVATLNGMDIGLDANKAAPPLEEALCVLATDGLLAKGNWDIYKPTSDYWNAQLAAHVADEADRARRMKEAQPRMAAFQTYPDDASKLAVHIAIVSRCERARKAITG